MSHLRTELPNFLFNSALITKFKDGNDFIGFHSDDEPEIVMNSYIVTVSLCDTRTLIFKSKGQDQLPSTSVDISHGDLYCMSRESQDKFMHSIGRDSRYKSSRISITFRLLYNGTGSTPSNFAPTNSAATSTVGNLLSSSTDNSSSSTSHPASAPEHVSTVYISSSMFRNLNAGKLSSDSQKAAVIYYPGATAGSIQSKLKTDSTFSQIDPKHVKNVFLLCGTNNVDQVLGISRSHDKNIVDNNHTSFSDRKLYNTKTEIQDLIMYLNEWSQSAVINILNVLPRVSRVRNEVINEINSFSCNLANRYTFVNFISTETNRNMFCDGQGYRNNNLFNFRGRDNIH